MKHDLGTWVDELRHIRVPVLEHSVHNFRRLLLQDGTTVAHFTKVMDSDPALTFAILRHVHTVMGDRLQEDSITPETAVTLLGFGPLENLINKLPVVKARDRGPKARALRRLARQSSFLRYLCQSWCEERRDVCPPDTILAARLSVIMEMALWEAGAKDSLTAIEKGLLTEGADYGVLQEQHLGVRINKLNQTLGKDWGLPDLLAQPGMGSPVDAMHKLSINQAGLLARLITVDWHHPGLPSLYEWVGFYLHMDTDEARKHLVQVALHAARHDSDIGLPALAAGLMRLTSAPPRQSRAIPKKASVDTLAKKVAPKPRDPSLLTQEVNVAESLGMDVDISPPKMPPVTEVSASQVRAAEKGSVTLESVQSDKPKGGVEYETQINKPRDQDSPGQNVELVKPVKAEVELGRVVPEKAAAESSKVVDLSAHRKPEESVAKASDLLDAMPKTLKPDPAFYKSAYKQLDVIDSHGVMIEHLLQILHKGLGLQRAMALMGVKGKKALQVRYHRFWENDPSLRNMQVGLDKPTLFTKLMKDERALWVNSKNRMQLWPYLPSNFRDLIRVREFFLMTIILKGRPIGFIYADRFRGAQPLDDETYKQFKAVVHHAIQRMNAI